MCWGHFWCRRDLHLSYLDRAPTKCPDYTVWSSSADTGPPTCAQNHHLGGDFPPRFLAGFRRNPFRARRGGPVGWVSGFGFSGLNFRGSNPGGVPFFKKPRVGGRGCTSASGGRPAFILGFRVFHFWFRSSLVPHPPCWLSRLGVGFGGAKVVGSIPGRDLFFQNARRELETCRFSFRGTCPCTFLKEIHSLARVRVRSLRNFIPWHVSGHNFIPWHVSVYFP